MINQPECEECNSKEFVLVEVTERTIDHFDEKNKPIDYIGKEVVESTIQCTSCGYPLEQKG